MGYCHFRQAAHQQQGDQRADGVAEQHAGAGETNGKGAAHEQAGANRATDGDHAHLPRRQLPAQAVLALGDGFKTLGIGHHSVLWLFLGALQGCW
ncbi:hypothetical protein D3C76_968910 [compost metagenome]